jgi:hypothetical protein
MKNNQLIEIISTAIRQIKENFPLMLILAFIPLVILVGIFFLSSWSDIPIHIFMKDAAQSLDTPSYVGIVSEAGVFLLVSIAVICFLSCSVLKMLGDQSSCPGFFRYFGFFMLLLMLDDKFLLHELVYSVWLPEKAVYISYLVILSIGIIKYQQELLASKFIFLLIGAGFLGLSLSVDLFQERIEQELGSIRILIEDGFKLMGFVSWFGYFFITSRQYILQGR